ncbi:three-Cys-motif partner protein TcmP [Archangium sp.]|jgi:three-Cys-motif partner protein|uniref:three-Cys-motif partner protein TcmP n=1 Tax=Archangium sp. TaxID=1872627 RepID=UPI002ED8ACEC
MTIPEEYKGREQTYLKHRVLSEYLDSWAHKWASIIRGRKSVRLWYVDCFAGPWQANDEALEDTSVAIGLNALKQAAETWSRQGFHIDLSAIFVEKDKKAFGRLESFLKKRAGPIDAKPLPGEFGDYVDNINRAIRNDPAFLFVDPTGWKGAGMRNIAPLAGVRGRDVLINVMFNHINRFKDDPRSFLREQMRDFFGLTESDVPPALTEEQLFSLYRKQLRQKGGVRFAADLIIPHPTHDRTWFRLVIGGHNKAVVDLFRHVEKRICGDEAGEVREQARSRGQLNLILGLSQSDPTYARLHDDGLRQASEDVLKTLTESSPQSFGELWPQILCERHITKAELGKEVWKLHTQGRLVIQNLVGKQRTPKDENLLVLPDQQ